MILTVEENEFDEIRPYNDDELMPVMKRLVEDREMADTLLSMKYPVASRYLGWALRPLVRHAFRKACGEIHSVRDLQELIGEQMKVLLNRHGTQFTLSGVDRLQPGSAYLFISNHRDIAMDPAYVNLALYERGLDTVRIAIGDNLLTKPFASDLMRLNKSFIVRRSVTGRREKLKALTTLSRYIRYSIVHDRTCVWIAQREGRAKDGIDRTDSALIKMLSLGRDREQDFGQSIRELNLVPVSISYCFDPCDRDKARELHERQSSGHYQKKPHEDLVSIYKGIVGDKGAVHLAFGEPLTAAFDSPEAVARELDRQIIGNYRLHPTNLIAWERLNGPDARIAHWKAACSGDLRTTEEALMARVAGESEQVRRIFLSMYANPVQSLLDLEGR